MSASPVRMNTLGIEADILRNPSGLPCGGAAISGKVRLLSSSTRWRGWGSCGCSTDGDGRHLGVVAVVIVVLVLAVVVGGGKRR